MIQRDRIFAVSFCLFVAAFSMLAMLSLHGCSSGPTQPITAPTPVVSQAPALDQSCCAQAWPGTHSAAKHTTRATGYTPENTTMEGGPHDRYGQPLRTLQKFLDGKAEYVSTAIDQNLGKVKRKICVPELNETFGKPISFYVVDTGGAFKGKGWSRIDIATQDQAHANSSKINRGGLTLIECVQ